MNYYTSDLHFGHTNIIRFDDRPFTTVEEMDSAIINNWNNIVTHLKRGSCCIKDLVQINNVRPLDCGYSKIMWVIDTEIPTFTQDRNYIDNKIYFENN